jgi:hypothetical protein
LFNDPARRRQARLATLGQALYAPILADPVKPPNHARFLFLNRHAGDFWRDRNQAADDTLALLRGSAARDPYDERLSNLIAELSTRSNDFRVRACHRGWPICRLPSGKRTPTAPASKRAFSHRRNHHNPALSSRNVVRCVPNAEGSLM